MNRTIKGLLQEKEILIPRHDFASEMIDLAQVYNLFAMAYYIFTFNTFDFSCIGIDEIIYVIYILQYDLQWLFL